MTVAPRGLSPLNRPFAMTTPRQPLYITMHPQDNVAIVANDGGLPAGTVFASGLTLTGHVPQGHKVALEHIPQNAPVRRYNEIGRAHV